MKRNLFGICGMALLVCAGTASADILAEDSANNYTDETFVNGANLGTGFGNWEFWNASPTLADSTAGVCGDVNSENGVSFRFARSADNEWCNGYRGFEALNINDTLSFRFTCAYCGGGRGLDLFANGGHGDSDKIANVIHLSGDNEFSVNGTVIASNWAPNAVTAVSVVQEADGIVIAVARTTPDESGEGNVAYWTKVETDKKLTGIGIYAGGWDWNDGADVENYAFYVNDLKLEGEPPADTLSLDGPWAVTAKEAELSFKVTRTKSEGPLAVTLASSYPDFASVPPTVTFAEGETEAAFTVAATLQGNANSATITASAEGVAGASFGVKGPEYSCKAWDEGVEEPWKVDIGGTRTLWVNNECTQEQFPANDALVSVESANGEIVAVSSLAEWAVGDNAKSYTSCQVSGIAAGSAPVKVFYDGVEMASYEFTVPAPLVPGFKLDGPLAPKAETPCTYTLEAILTIAPVDCTVSVSPEGAAIVDPASFTLEESEDGNLYVQKISVTFTQTGPATITVESDNYSASLDVDVAERPDYSKFIAYDDASLYGGSFDFAAVGVGTDKFQPWTEVFNNNEGDGHRAAGVILVGNAPDAAALSEDSAFALYANGDAGDAEIRIRRPFVSPLSSGQAFSVQMSPNYRDGAKGVVIQGEWDGAWYDRVEFYCSGESYAYKINGGDPVDLGWAYGTKLIGMTLQCAADGSSYTLSFSREGDSDVTVEDLTFAGSVDGALFYSWNGGYGDENNFVFNRLAIEQVEEPVVVRSIWWAAGTSNPDGAGEYTFTIGASTTDIGLVNLAIDPADGDASLSADSVDLTGVTEASFAVTLSEAVPGAKFTITATPADPEVEALAYDIYPRDPVLTLNSKDGRWEFSPADQEIWLYVEASPANYGTCPLAISGEEGVLELSTDSVTLPGEDDEYGRAWFNVYIKGPGNATVYLADFAPDAEGKSWNFTIKPSADLPPFTVVKGRGLAWNAAALQGTTILGSDALLGKVFPNDWTELVENEDYVIEGEGDDAQLIVLFDGKFFSGKQVGFLSLK